LTIVRDPFIKPLLVSTLVNRFTMETLELRVLMLCDSARSTPLDIFSVALKKLLNDPSIGVASWAFAFEPGFELMTTVKYECHARKFKRASTKQFGQKISNSLSVRPGRPGYNLETQVPRNLRIAETFEQIVSALLILYSLFFVHSYNQATCQPYFQG